MNRALLQEINNRLKLVGGKPFMVGGTVRDSLLGLPLQDIDLEVFSINLNHPFDVNSIPAALSGLGGVDTFGKSFQIYQLNVKEGEERIKIDISIPRRDIKTGTGHRAFLTEGDPNMDPKEACSRRDFTINSMLMDLVSGVVIDPYGGEADLKNRILRVTMPETFIEDSLRVLRGMQLAARFELAVEPNTMSLFRTINLSDLPKERVWDEFKKLLLLSKKPSIGYQVAVEAGIFEQLLPEFLPLEDCPQSPIYHPEGSVGIHTRMVLDNIVKLSFHLPKVKQIAVNLAAMCHDLGKPDTTQEIDGHITSRKHQEVGVPITEKVLDKLNVNTIDGYDVRNQVLLLVRWHLEPALWYKNKGETRDKSFYKLAETGVELGLLSLVSKADLLGRGGNPTGIAADWFYDRATHLKVREKPIEPILKGRHLIETFGMTPGKHFGPILEHVKELQMSGLVNNLAEAIEAASSYMKEGD